LGAEQDDRHHGDDQKATEPTDVETGAWSRARIGLLRKLPKQQGVARAPRPRGTSRFRLRVALGAAMPNWWRALRPSWLVAPMTFGRLGRILGNGVVGHALLKLLMPWATFSQSSETCPRPKQSRTARAQSGMCAPQSVPFPISHASDLARSFTAAYGSKGSPVTSRVSNTSVIRARIRRKARTQRSRSGYGFRTGMRRFPESIIDLGRMSSGFTGLENEDSA